MSRTKTIFSTDLRSPVVKLFHEPLVSPRRTNDPPNHPRISEWRDLVAGVVLPDAARMMAAHLEYCQPCSQAVAALPPPPYYSLGRPLPPTFSLPPHEIETQAKRVISIVQSRVGGGGVVRLTGDWKCESSFYLVLSLAITRLRRLGLTVAVHGEVFNLAKLTEPPETDIAVLLEAPAYQSWKHWVLRKPGQLTLLTGSQFDWRDDPVDFVLSCGDGKVAEPVESYRDTYRALWTESPDSALSDALTMNALGVDCPSVMAPFNRSPLFVPVETQFGRRVAWWSVEGQWAAWASMRDLLTASDIAKLVGRLSAFPSIVDRLQVRSEVRNLCG